MDILKQRDQVGTSLSLQIKQILFYCFFAVAMFVSVFLGSISPYETDQNALRKHLMIL